MSLASSEEGETAAPTASRAPCEVCGGAGIRYEADIEVGRYGTLELCRCILDSCRCDRKPPFRYWDEEGQNRPCPCRQYRRRLTHVSQLFKQAEIPERFRWKFRRDFSAFAPDGQTPIPVEQKAKKALDLVSWVVGSDEEPQRGFLLYGSPGTGKTLLGSIILNELILHRARAGRFLNLSRKYFQKLRDTYSHDSEHYGQTWQIVDALCKIPYLVLDDFGVQRGTDWETEMLYDLVDARYGEQRFTMITTNQSLDEIRELSGGRIFSRLTEMCYTVDMIGTDYRQFLRSD